MTFLGNFSSTSLFFPSASLICNFDCLWGLRETRSVARHLLLTTLFKGQRVGVSRMKRKGKKKLVLAIIYHHTALFIIGASLASADTYPWQVCKNTVRCILRVLLIHCSLAPYFLVQIGLIYTTLLKFVRPNNYYSPNNYRKKALNSLLWDQFWKFTTVCLSPSGPMPCYPIPVSFHPFRL